MITATTSFQGEITKLDIEIAAELYGYEGYIPHGFLKDLVISWINLVINGDMSSGIIVENEYDKQFKQFVEMLPKETGFYKKGFSFVFDILRQYASKLNLRAVEQNRKSGNSFNFEEKIQLNYNIDLSKLNSKMLKILEVEQGDFMNEVVLSKEILDILRFLNEFKAFPGFIDKESILIRSKMKSYNQVVKISKHRFVYPTFKYNYITKNLRVKIPVIEKKDRNNILIVIDVSSSMKEESTYQLVYKAILLHYYMIFKDGTTKIYLYFTTNRPHHHYIIEEAKKIKAIINTPLKSIISIRSWQGTFDFFEKEFLDEQIIYVTDGLDYGLKRNNLLNNVWNIITFNDNAFLKKLCKDTKGKYIEIWKK